MATYKEKLESQEWKDKRKEILIRDNYTCQRCGLKEDELKEKTIYANIESTDEFPLRERIIINSNDHFTTNIATIKRRDQKAISCKTALEKDFDKEIEYFVSFNLAVKSHIKYPFNGSRINNLNQNLFLSSNVNQDLFNELRIKLNEKIDFDNYDFDLEGVYLHKKWGAEHHSKYCLQVHHKCYRQDVEMWDQPNEEYVSLCNICHKIVHENQMIPYYDKYGTIIQNTIPCSRCGGACFFPEYSHVNGGRCFKCNGRGYEIDSSEFFQLLKTSK